MPTVKRVEIITNSVELPEIERVLDEMEVSGYSVMPGVLGMGNRGRIEGDELTGVCTNVYILIACSEAEAKKISEAMRPVLKRFGGICLISEAEYVNHDSELE
ncbi:MAG: transcriptional regulator [Gammaproteobacteria bacterium]|nr:transcriptional regulator [Gammaproteobacteria bacterium]